MNKYVKTALIATSAAAAIVGAILIARRPVPIKSDTEWAIYLYLCGSDLESGHSAASDDIGELLTFPLPEKTEVVIQTGGSRSWTNNKINADKLCRLCYCGDKLNLEEKAELQNMGDPQTLSDFLLYCMEKHPAKHSMLIIWNHGGGTLGGVAYDTVFNSDSLSLPELNQALGSILVPEEGGTESGKLLDLIGFDACLMSTLDTADVCSRYADWMVASQQLEPVCGWNYAELANALENPQALTAENLGKSACDAFYKGCEAIGLGEASTLALIDLDALQNLKKAYEDAVYELFDASLVSDESMASVRKSASTAENYGVNGKAVGYTDMIDMLEFLGTERTAVKSATDEAVVYKVCGSAAKNACGISTYYPLDESIRSVYQYGKASDAENDIKLFFRYLIDPQVNDDISEYAEKRGISKESILTERYQVSEDDLRVIVPENGQGEIVLEVEPEKAAKMAGFKAVLSTEVALKNTEFEDSGSDEMYYIRENGERQCLLEDYSNGRFVLDKNIKLAFAGDVELAAYISSVEDDIIKYYSPVVIDGHDGFFLFSADKDSNDITFLGEYYGDEHVQGQYYLGDNTDTDALAANAVGGDGSKSFIGRRLYPIRNGQTVCALHSTMLSSLRDPYAKDAVVISSWEESDPFICNENTKFEFVAYDYGIDANINNTGAVNRLVRFAAKDEGGQIAYAKTAIVNLRGSAAKDLPAENESVNAVEETEEYSAELRRTVTADDRTAENDTAAQPPSAETEAETEAEGPRYAYGSTSNAGTSGGSGLSRNDPTEPEKPSESASQPESESETESEPKSGTEPESFVCDFCGYTVDLSADIERICLECGKSYCPACSKLYLQTCELCNEYYCNDDSNIHYRRAHPTATPSETPTGG